MNLIPADLQNIKRSLNSKSRLVKNPGRTRALCLEGITDPGQEVEPFVGISVPLFVLLESKIIELGKHIEPFGELIPGPHIEVDDWIHHHLGGGNG